MIIKHPEKENIPALTELWMQAFGDTREFIAGFFRTGFSHDRCLLAEEQGQLLAALYWFDCTWEGKKVAYLYAIATDESHRGKGICKKLMAHTHQVLKDKGYVGAILVPADAGLARMYGKLGYQSVISSGGRQSGIEKSVIPKETDLSTPHLRCSAQDDTEKMEVQKITENHCQLDITPISVEEYRKLQEKLLPENAVVHTDAAFSYLQTFASFYKTKDGICCKTQEHIQEILPYTPTGKNRAMYLSLTEDKTLPAYFALPLA